MQIFPVPTKGRAPNCAPTQKKSSTAHARLHINGKFCAKKIPTSWKRLQLEAKNTTQSDVYSLYDQTSKSFYQTFCDFSTEGEFVWTVVESFSLANKNEFEAKQFYKDAISTFRTSPPIIWQFVVFLFSKATQKSNQIWAKIHLLTKHLQSWCNQWTLLIQLTYSCFRTTIYSPTTYLLCSWHKQHTVVTHKYFLCSKKRSNGRNAIFLRW